MAVTDSDVAPIYRKYYGKYGLEFVGMKKAMAVFVGRLYKDSAYAGVEFHSAMEYNDVQNASHTASTALGNTDGGDEVAFTASPKKDFNQVSIEKFAMSAAKKRGALADLFTYKMNSLLRAMYLRLEQGFFGSFGGWIGQVATGGVSGTVVTLTRASDARWFQRNMQIVSSEGDGTSSAHALQSGFATVASSDASPGVGTVTAQANWTTGIPALDADDYLFKAGDFKLAWNGLDDYNPTSTASLSTSFLSVDRSVAPIRLAGSRKTGTGEDIFSAIQQMDAMINSEGGQTTDYWMNPLTMTRAIEEARASGFVTQTTGMPGRSSKGNKELDVGFESLSVWTGYGNKRLNASIGCPDNVIRATNMDKDSLVAFHLDEDMVAIDRGDGNKMLREVDNFSYQVRAYSFCNLLSRRPVDLGVITVDSPTG